jgi:antitoxin component YwqK of YwqJK toxin-antitoxin module
MKRNRHTLNKFIVTAAAACLAFAGTRLLAQDTVRSDGFQKFYYQNGVLSSEGTMRSGKPDGYWKAYFENGKLKSEGNRKSFELDRLWRFYNETGSPVLEIFYRNGKKNGVKTTYLDRETVKESFVNDVKEGWTRYYLPDGTLKLEIPFVKGLEQGTGKEYDAGGNIITITEYKRGFITDRMKVNRKDKNGLKQGVWVIFHPNGRIKQEGTYRDDKKNGYFKDYTENGDLIRVTKYVEDIAQPDAAEIAKLQVQNEYYPDGRIKSTTMYRNGIPEGVKREFKPDGTIERSVEYHDGAVIGEGIVLEDGSRDGAWKEFYSDGSLRAEGLYESGKRVGEWKFYHPNGKTEQLGKFTKSGKPDGTWRWYYDNGQLLREEAYYNGLKDGLSEEYDETGTLVEKGEYLEGKEDGFWFTSTGDHCYKGSYRDGLRTGPWEGFYLTPADGKVDSTLSFSGNFIEDLPDGKHTWYWDNGKIREEGTYVMGSREGNWNVYNYDGTLFLVITYAGGIETRYDGVKIKPPFDKNE